MSAREQHCWGVHRRSFQQVSASFPLLIFFVSMLMQSKFRSSHLLLVVATSFHCQLLPRSILRTDVLEEA